MIDYNKINDSINEQWLKNRGRGTVCIYHPLSVIACLYPTFIKYLNANPTKSCFIVIDDFNYRNTIIQHFQQNLGIKNSESYLNRMKIVTAKFMKNIPINYEFVTIIGVEDYNFVQGYANSIKFILNVVTNSKIDLGLYNSFATLFPVIIPNVNIDEVIKSKIYSPVKEHRIQIILDEETFTRYKKQSDYIVDSMKIFGNLDTVTACRIGDIKSGLSAIECRNKIARYNGWSETLDKSVEINKKIDAVFNPLAIEERANNVFNISRLRRYLVETYDSKLKEILKIIYKNPDKKIIIVSKSGSFANDVAQYINKQSNGNLFCGQYHNDIPKSYLPDANGKPITYKTGANKGKEKLFGSAALSNYYLDLYNNNFIKLLSIKSASDTELKCDCDIVIFTSTLLPNIFEFKTRYANINFPDSCTEIYRLYCKDTIEESVFYKEEQSNLITICDELEQSDIKINESTGEIIL